MSVQGLWSYREEWTKHFQKWAVHVGLLPQLCAWHTVDWECITCYSCHGGYLPISSPNFILIHCPCLWWIYWRNYDPFLAIGTWRKPVQGLTASKETKERQLFSFSGHCYLGTAKALQPQESNLHSEVTRIENILAPQCQHLSTWINSPGATLPLDPLHVRA